MPQLAALLFPGRSRAGHGYVYMSRDAGPGSAPPPRAQTHTHPHTQCIPAGRVWVERVCLQVQHALDALLQHLVLLLLAPGVQVGQHDDQRGQALLAVDELQGIAGRVPGGPELSAFEGALPACLLRLRLGCGVLPAGLCVWSRRPSHVAVHACPHIGGCHACNGGPTCALLHISPCAPVPTWYGTAAPSSVFVATTAPKKYSWGGWGEAVEGVHVCVLTRNRHHARGAALASITQRGRMGRKMCVAACRRAPLAPNRAPACRGRHARSPAAARRRAWCATSTACKQHDAAGDLALGAEPKPNRTPAPPGQRHDAGWLRRAATPPPTHLWYTGMLNLYSSESNSW